MTTTALATTNQDRTAPPPLAAAGTTAEVRRASQKRAEQPLLTTFWAIEALWDRLPLPFAVEPTLPPSPKRAYRSHYRYLGATLVRDPESLATLSDFEIALALIDFAPLERRLATIYVPSQKGQRPFHPVSLFLAIGLRRELKLGWQSLARLLAGRQGVGWRTLFGFADGDTPSASGLRYFFQAVGPDVFDELCPRFVTLLREHGLFPERSTYPGDPEDRGITVCQDGMLHPARSRPSCQLTTDACYQPLPEDGTGRPCRAREQGREGCACDPATCQAQCERASRLDPEARLIHYDGHNHKHGPEAGKTKGTDVFGYRSVAERALDDRFAVAWTLRSTVYPANTDERTIFVPRLTALVTTFPDLRLGEWLDDAGVGYGDCLDAIWQQGAIRMVDIRADRTDDDPEACLRRGYDGRGRPLCPHGYPMRANGYDAEHRRAKYVCAQACRREPRREGEPVQPVEGCPYLDPAHPLGAVTNVGKTLADGSLRLAREIPYGSPAWKARYGRRNLSESRNGQLEGLGLKRMPAYGLERITKEVQVADFLINLRTLGRLVREATNLNRA